MFGNVPRALWSQWIVPDDENRHRARVPLPACNRSRRQDRAVRDRNRRVLRAEAARALRRHRERARAALRRSRRAVYAHEDVDAVVLCATCTSITPADCSVSLARRRAASCCSRTRHSWSASKRGSARASRIRATARRSSRDLPICSSERAARDRGRRALARARRSRALPLQRRPHAGAHARRGRRRRGVVFCSDLIPGRPWVHLPVTMGYDRYPELLIDEKRGFLEDKIARGVRLFFTHDLGCAVATPARDASGRFGVAHEQASLDGWQPPTRP